LTIASVATLLFGAGSIAYALTVVWGPFLQDSAFVRRTRAQYEYRSPVMDSLPFGPDRLIVMIPFFGFATLATGIASVLPRDRSLLTDALIPIAAMSFVFAIVAFVWPRPFLPSWAKDADARRLAGVPPIVPPPPDLVAARQVTKRQVLAVFLGITVALMIAIVLGAPPTLLGAFGFAYATLAAFYARSRNRSGEG
jgi:hypothetical protein